MNLVLIHGALGAAEQLEPLRRRLDRDFTVHLVELAGHGNTALGSDGYSVPGFVGGVARAMDDAKVREAAIFGYSMGGYVALALAAAVPSRVSAVVTLGTKLAWSPEVAELLGRIARPVRFMVGDRDALVSVEETEAAANQTPKGELVVLPNTPHPIEQIDVELVAGMVTGFLSGLSTK